MGSDSAYGEPNYATPLGTNRTRATGPEVPVLLESPAEKLRRLLPEAKRLLSRQHIGAPWHALLAAEDLLAEVDALERQAEAGMAQIEATFAKAFPGGLLVLKEELERGEAQRTTLGQTLARLMKEKDAAAAQDGEAEPAVEAGP